VSIAKQSVQGRGLNGQEKGGGSEKPSAKTEVGERGGGVKVGYHGEALDKGKCFGGK